MSASAVTLCNEALRLLGEGAIASFEEGSDLANTCGALYQGTVDALMAAHPWRFTMRQQQLSRHATPPLTQWAHAHQLPAELIVLRALYASPKVGADPVLQFERFDRDVHSDRPDLWCHYQVRTDPATWPPLFRQLARFALAADFAVPVTSSLTAADAYFRRAFGNPGEGGHGGMMRMARTADAQQQQSPALQQFPLIQARLAGWFR
jgi:hypothetical protein